MTKKELKGVKEFSKILFIVGFVFWLLETIYFLIKGGRHFKAVTPDEIFCDNIVTQIWATALSAISFYFVYKVFKL